MTLHLDARQRAMLLEMGITVWLPGPAAALTAAPPAPAVTTPPREAASPPAPPPAPTPVAAPAPRSLPPREQVIPAMPPPAYSADLARGWRLHPARPVYAPPAAAEADAGWLILLEQPAASGLPVYPPAPGPDAAPSPLGTALEGDAAQLLDQMLRALRLHQHPRVWSAALERSAAAADPLPHTGHSLSEDLLSMVQALRPARVLVFGLAAARAVLGRSEPLGRLRAEPHELAGRPVVVTYDPNYLLRAPQAKAAAWADLCRAQALGLLR